MRPGGSGGIAYDGFNLWIANYSGNTVTKLRASDGKVLATTSVGPNPYGVAFDGTYIWVTSSGSGTVSKLQVGDGSVLGTFAVGVTPVAVAFDRTNIWVANAGNNTVTKLSTSEPRWERSRWARTARPGVRRDQYVGC